MPAVKIESSPEIKLTLNLSRSTLGISADHPVDHLVDDPILQEADPSREVNPTQEDQEKNVHLELSKVSAGCFQFPLKEIYVLRLKWRQ